MSIKLQFTHQKFQADAARSVCDVFSGQPFMQARYTHEAITPLFTSGFSMWGNHEIELDDEAILTNIQNIQRGNGLMPSESLEGKYNLTVEMETGTGKTYTYIKTIYELNKLYGWSKFIIVVPSIAIREGVYGTFQITDSHFVWDYEKRADYFIYDSSNLSRINGFVSDSHIKVMIINSQAFNARGADARRIRMELDTFGSMKPLDVISQVRPIMIIDEPQSVEGTKTKESLKDFNPLFTLRYSATPREKYNLVYRLDALDAYNRKLVKMISVTGISQCNVSASKGYVYLKGINKSEKDPTATIEFDVMTSGGIKRVTRKVHEGFNLYDASGGLEEYKNNFVVRIIDGLNMTAEFLNGMILKSGEIAGSVNEEDIRRIQIRETIETHIERERQLFSRGIKVLSLFFIDEVAKYRRYDDNGEAMNGIYARIFEEEYREAVKNFQHGIESESYYAWLESISPERTHSGYFSVDKHNRMTESRIKNKKEGTTDDVSAFDLIMRDKERLLSLDEPVRFIFSHSALREGWDNPNVFQICTLKNSTNDIRRRQEVGRGMRLAVNQEGIRITEEGINELTVIASESYRDFATGLQSEIAETLSYRPKTITQDLFIKAGIDEDTALSVYEELIREGYIAKGHLTAKYHDDRNNDALSLNDDIVKLLDASYSPEGISIKDKRNAGIRIKLDTDKLYCAEFQRLWEKINHHSVYAVEFDENELIRKAASELDMNLNIPSAMLVIAHGKMKSIKSKEELESGESFSKETTHSRVIRGKGIVIFDVVGRLSELTGLTRKVIVKILERIDTSKLAMFANNPEIFIVRAAEIINAQKANAVVEHIRYNMLEETYDVNIFSDASLKSIPYESERLAHTPIRGLYDYMICDSANEKIFAEELDTCRDVAVYTKLPRSFCISTPVGRYNPDWAISFVEGDVKHIYFVAETKGSMSSLQLRLIEEAKIKCAEEHFRALNGKVKYHVINNFQELMNLVKG